MNYVMMLLTSGIPWDVGTFHYSSREQVLIVLFPFSFWATIVFRKQLPIHLTFVQISFLIAPVTFWQSIYTQNTDTFQQLMCIWKFIFFSGMF